jgi:hypothetical protein
MSNLFFSNTWPNELTEQTYSQSGNLRQANFPQEFPSPSPNPVDQLKGYLGEKLGGFYPRNFPVELNCNDIKTSEKCYEHGYMPDGITVITGKK